ncbi:uncharacterized protein [Hyperolius riggenbachi]|uniref:uncharacterized protein n=1 Tax=Hyperolius riggenbachi TaxID=752182 RepID=UPI0035A38F1B
MDPNPRVSESTRLEPASTGLSVCTDPLMQQALQKLMDTDLDKYLQYMREERQSAEARTERQMREERERQAAAAERHAERDAAEREWERQRQHELNMAKVQQASLSSPPSLPAEGAAPPVSAKFKFANIEKDIDIDLFLRSFEKACRQYRLFQDQWARHLTPLLRYKALDAFAELPAEKDNDYAAIKDAIITKYQLTPEAYRKKFRAWQKKSSDSYRDVASSLLTTLRQWTLGLTKGSYGVLEDLIVLEQFLNICPADVRQFVLERKPASATVAADLAETFATTRVSDARRTASSSWRGGQSNTLADSPAPVSRPPQRPPSAAAAPRPAAPGEVTCHYCRQPGHMKFDCPERRQTPPAPGSSASPAPHPQQRQPASEPQPGSSDFVLFARGKEIRDRTDQQQLVRVNGKLVTGFRDTGADITLVHSHLVPKESISSSLSLALTGVEGTLFHIAQATVKLDWGVGGIQERVVGVMKDLPVPVLLGTDLGKLVSYYEPATTALSLTEGDGLSTHHQSLPESSVERTGNRSWEWSEGRS